MWAGVVMAALLPPQAGGCRQKTVTGGCRGRSRWCERTERRCRGQRSPQTAVTSCDTRWSLQTSAVFEKSQIRVKNRISLLLFCFDFERLSLRYAMLSYFYLQPRLGNKPFKFNHLLIWTNYSWRGITILPLQKSSSLHSCGIESVRKCVFNVHNHLGHNIDAGALQHSLQILFPFHFCAGGEKQKISLLFSALIKSDCIFPFFQLLFLFSASSKLCVTREWQIKWTVAHLPQDAGNDISLRQSSADSEKLPIRLFIAFKWICLIVSVWTGFTPCFVSPQ